MKVLWSSVVQHHYSNMLCFYLWWRVVQGSPFILARAPDFDRSFSLKITELCLVLFQQGQEVADPESAVHRKWADLCWPLITARNGHVLHTCSYRGNVHPLEIYNISLSSIIYLTPTLLSLCNPVSWLACACFSLMQSFFVKTQYSDQVCLSTVHHTVHIV